MRTLTPLAPLLMLLATLAACRSQKAVQKDEALAVDSLASTAQHRSIASLDSAFARLSLDFDTLDITIERETPMLPTDTAALTRKETLKLRAVANSPAPVPGIAKSPSNTNDATPSLTTSPLSTARRNIQPPRACMIRPRQPASSFS